MEKEEKVDRRSGGNTILISGQGWTLPTANRLVGWLVVLGLTAL